jgi:predicted MFS family arabinose efflux permease
VTAVVFSERAVRGAVFFLIAAVGVEFLHRQLLAVAQPTLLPDLGLSDTQAGLLVFGFAVAYAVSALGIGRLADRTNRRNLYAAGIATWSVATALGALTGSFAALLATRMLAGAAQGISGACNNPLISDYVPPERRSTALGLVGVGAALGVVLALTAGGVVAQEYGWRVAFAGGGLLGIAFTALFMARVHEPPRGWSEGLVHEPAQAPAPSWGAVLRTVGSLTALRHVVFASILANTALMVVAQWGPTFFVRVHGLGVAEGGLAGGAGALFAVAGGVFGGIVADRAWKVSPARMLRIPALCFVLATPLVYAAFSATSVWASLALIVVSMGLGMVHTAPAGAAVQALAPLPMRAVVSGAVNASLTLMAMGGGPLLTGWLSDRLGASEGGSGLARALAWSAVLYLWAGVHLFVAARSFRADLERSRAASA